jgi:hypothetical protein
MKHSTQSMLLFGLWCLLMSVRAGELLEIKEKGGFPTVLPVCSERESVNENDGVMVPSFLVASLYKRLNDIESFESAAPAYMRGFWRELAQLLTNNPVYDYRTVLDKWFRYGGEDARTYFKDLKDSYDTVPPVDILRRFGFEKVYIVGAYSVLGDLEYGNPPNRACVFAPKDILERLRTSSVRPGGLSPPERLLAWMSPHGSYQLNGSALPRMIIIESVADTSSQNDERQK